MLLFFLFSSVVACWSQLIPPVVFQVGENFVPPLLDAVLIDYQRNVPAAREPEVLSTMATIVNKLGGHITGEIPQIFDAVFECTLNMINKVSLKIKSGLIIVLVNRMIESLPKHVILTVIYIMWPSQQSVNQSAILD